MSKVIYYNNYTYHCNATLPSSVGASSYEITPSQGSNVTSIPAGMEDDHPDMYIPEEVKVFLPYFHKQIKAKVILL